MEGLHFRKTGKLESLSAQNLLDCSKSYGNKGCKGGHEFAAFQYIEDNGGIDTEKSYPYEGKDDNKCRFNSKDVGAKVKGFAILRCGDETALTNAIATVGPIAVSIAATDDFVHYKSGIYSNPKCVGQRLNHVAVAIGYGIENGQPYYLIKNSFGANWGENGFGKIARNAGNMCGIASEASFPLL